MARSVAEALVKGRVLKLPAGIIGGVALNQRVRSAMEAALGKLKTNADVAQVDYNLIFDPPVSAQRSANAPLAPVSLTLNPPGDSGRVIVGLVDTPIQSLGAELDSFILKQISVAGEAAGTGTDPTHATSMAETILRAMEIAGRGGTSAQILPVDVYGQNPNTTSWDVAAGILLVEAAGGTVKLTPHADNPDKYAIVAASGKIDLP